MDLDFGLEDWVGLVTDPGSSLTPQAAERRGILLLNPEAPLEQQYAHWLGHYDRLISLHASPKLCPFQELAAAAAAKVAPQRIHFVNTNLGSAGLGEAAVRAAELRDAGATEEGILGEVSRLAREGRFYLLTPDLKTLVRNQMLPPLNQRLGELLGRWALISLQKGALTRPIPVPRAHAIPNVAMRLAHELGERQVRVRVTFGPQVDDAHRKQMLSVLEKHLRLERGTVAPMDPLARGRVGERAMAVFAYPV